MALTSTTSRADRRRTRHMALLAAAPAGRLRLWAAWRWLLAEAARLPTDRLDDLADRLAAHATELNGTAGDRV